MSIFNRNTLCINIIADMVSSFIYGLSTGLNFRSFLLVIIITTVILIARIFIGIADTVFIEIINILIVLIGWCFGKFISLYMETKIVKPGGITEEEWEQMKSEIWW